MASNREIASALHSLDKVLQIDKERGCEYVQIGSAALEQLRELPAELSRRAGRAIAAVEKSSVVGPVIDTDEIDPSG